MAQIRRTIMEEHRASMQTYYKVHKETVRSELRMAIAQHSIEMDIWEIKEQLSKRRDLMMEDSKEVKARFQDSDGKFSSVLAEYRAESNRRHEELKMLILNLVPKPTLESMDVEIKEEETDDGVGIDGKMESILPELIPNNVVSKQPVTGRDDEVHQVGDEHKTDELILDSDKEKGNLCPHLQSDINNFFVSDPNIVIIKLNSGPFNGPILGPGIVNNKGINSTLINILHQGLDWGAKSILRYEHTFGASFGKIEGHIIYFSYIHMWDVFGPVFEPYYDASETKVWDPGIKNV